MAEEKRRIIDEDQTLVINPDDLIYIDSSTNGSRVITYSALCDAVAVTLGIAAIKATADGAMQRKTYDSDGDGVVDNSTKLENHSADYFAKQTDVTTMGNEIGTKMATSVYDTDADGIVDNAAKVNNHTVDTDVPPQAIFTDTIYDDTELRNAVKKAQDTADAASKDLGLEVVNGKLCVVYSK